MVPEAIERRILLIRGQKVLLDTHLAQLYGVTTKRLNEQIRRNLRRFPADFMFQLTKEEDEALRSHFSREYEAVMHPLIDTASAQLPVERLCALAVVPRSSYYRAGQVKVHQAD
ncbi:MAG TPA: ORF6N domain-containing protein, partial [Bacteroidota bacterium]|nr:ORF6N domain-containing protein [Bacteroidota bacterium]